MGKLPAFSALASLYVDYRPWLVDRLRFRLRNHADAEDLASETFLQVAAARSPCQIAEPKAYLSTIAQMCIRERSVLSSPMRTCGPLSMVTRKAAEAVSACTSASEAVMRASMKSRTEVSSSRFDLALFQSFPLYTSRCV